MGLRVLAPLSLIFMRWFSKLSCAFFVVVLFLTSCASTSAVESAATESGTLQNVQSEQDSQNEQTAQEIAPVPPPEENSYVINWKNRGFGAEEPKWILPILEGDFSEFRKAFSVGAEQKLSAVFAQGENLDELESKMPDGKLAASSWVRVSPPDEEERYIAATVFYSTDTEDVATER